MYFLYNKRFVAIFMILLSLTDLAGQGEKLIPDSLLMVSDTTTAQKIVFYSKVSPDAIDATVSYKARLYKKNDLINKKVYLIGGGEVTYQNIYLSADSIVMDMDLGTIFASGRRDSTGNISGKATFREGQESYEVDQLEYNFRTSRALIRNVVTRQQEGFLHSSLTRKQEDGTLHFKASSFTTCDAEHPHFRLEMPKAKIYPDEKMVSGPAYLVVEDIPLPVIVPFFWFPVQKKFASGIIIPRYGQEQQRGYFLSEGGYYFAGTDHFDLKLTGNLYTNGTWMASAATRYNVRYKFSGNFSFNYASNISGHKGLPDFSKSKNYRIAWSHTQDPKSTPGSRLSANVNMSSSSYDRNNTYQPLDNVTTHRQSSVSYSKTWAGTPFNFQTSVNHSQNNANKTVSLNMPKAIFSMARIYPLKGRRSVGPAKWYQDLQLQYTAQLDNQVNTYDSLLFTSKAWANAKAGFKHEIPLSLQIRPFRNFTISPSLRYTGVLYPRKIEKIWVPDYFDPELNREVPKVIVDTLRGFAYGHAINPSISAGFNPQIFGYFTFTRPGSRVQQIRHVIKPSFSFSFIPNIKGLSSPMYREVQVDTLGSMSTYSVFENGIFGTPSLSQKNGNISISIVNILEAKVFEKNDTTGKPKKVQLIDNLGFSSSYNIFRDSVRWSPVAMSFRTTLLNQVGISAGGTFSLYEKNERGQETSRFLFQSSKKLAELRNLNASVDFDLGKLLGLGGGRKKNDDPDGTTTTGGDSDDPGGMMGAAPQATGGSSILGSPPVFDYDDYGYALVDLPWTMAVAYSFSYVSERDPKISQQVSLTGSLSIGTKTSISYVTGVDITRKDITMTRIGITRDLHCWEMSFNWVPTSYMKSWDFTIRIRSAMLSDLKYERRKDYRDNF